LEVIRPFPVDIGENLVRGTELALFDLPVAQGQQLQQRHRLFLLLVGPNIHHDELGFTVLGDQHGLAGCRDIPDDLGRVAFEITDWFDLG
jgi:hypothetical protein